jgi:hypothetical protein
LGKIPRKISPPPPKKKNVGKNGIFRGKSLEKLFFKEIPWNFPRKVIFSGKNIRKIGPWSESYDF